MGKEFKREREDEEKSKGKKMTRRRKEIPIVKTRNVVSYS